MANINISQILMKRGNTTAASTYIGPLGELLVDTGLKTIRVQDGVTAGGMAILPTLSMVSNITSNLSAAINSTNSNLASAVSTLTSSISTITGFDSNTIAEITSILGGTAGFGNIIPSANDTYNLGSPTNQWENLYLSGNSIYVGGTELSVVGGTLTVGGNLINANTSQLINGNYTATLNSNGSFTVPVAIDLPGGTITEGFGPGISILANVDLGQQFTVMSTGNTTNIGQSLIFTEQNQVGIQISDTNSNSNYSWTFDSAGRTVFPGNLVLSQSGGMTNDIAGNVTITNSLINNSAYITIPHDGFDTGVPLSLVNNSGNQIELSTGGKTLTFDGTGNITLPISSGIQWPHMNMVYTDNVADSQLTITDGEGSTYSFRKVAFKLSDNVAITFGNNDTAAIYPDVDGNISIVANSASYTFGINGSLTTPGDIVANGNISLGGGTIYGGTPTVTDINDTITAITLGTTTTITFTNSVFYYPTRGQITISNISTTTQANGTWYYEAVNYNAVSLFTDNTYATEVDSFGWTPYTNTDGLVTITQDIPGGSVTVDANGYLTTFSQFGQLQLPTSAELEGGQKYSVVQTPFESDLQLWVGGSTVYTFSANSELTLPNGGHLGPVGKGWTGLDGGNGQPVSLLSYYNDGMYSGCFTITPGLGAQITTYGDGTGQTGVWTFDNTGNLTISGNLIFADNTVQNTAFSNVAVSNYLANYDGSINFTASPAIISGAGTISTANLTVYDTAITGNIIPRANVTYTLGNVTNQWQSLYLSSNTIFIGGQTLSVASGQLALNGNTIGGNYSNANVATYLTTYSGNISNISFANGNLNLGGIQTPFDQTGTIYNVKGIVGLTASSGANISGFSYISAGAVKSDNYQFANGVSILSGITGTYSNANVAGYLPTYGGNINVGNVIMASNVSSISFPVGASIYSDSTNRIGSIVLQPAVTGTFPGVMIGGAGRILAPNGSVHLILNTSDFTVQVAQKIITGTVSTSTTTGALQVSGGIGVTGNINAGGNVTASYFVGNISTTSNINTTGNVIASNVIISNTYTVANIQTTGTYGNITGANVITANTFVGSGSQLTGVALSTTGSWTLATGSNLVSLTLPGPGTYSVWVNGNIPNGIVTYTATVVVTNSNVPVLGSQYGWYYSAGNALVLTSMPAQIVGTSGSISTATASTTTANVFTFGITNNSGSSQTVNWGYTKL